MSVTFRLTISEQLARRIEAKRGLLSLQAFTIQALVAACEGSMVEQELRAEIERLHLTLRAFGAQTIADQPAPEVAQRVADDDRRLGW
jgi:hypothetical protein